MEIILGKIVEKDIIVKEYKKKCYGKWNVPSGHLEGRENAMEKS